MSDTPKTFRPGILLHHLVALLAGLVCIAAALFVFKDLDWDNLEDKWNAVHSFGLIGIAVGTYLVSKILLPVRA